VVAGSGADCASSAAVFDPLTVEPLAVERGLSDRVQPSSMLALETSKSSICRDVARFGTDPGSIGALHSTISLGDLHPASYAFGNARVRDGLVGFDRHFRWMWRKIDI
jgi:hypothetical protein